MVARVAVLGALTGMTVVLPMTQSALADSDVTDSSGMFTTSRVALPSTIDALTSLPASQQPPAALVAAAGAAGTGVPAVAAAVTKASNPLPGCSGVRIKAAKDGEIPADSLCTLWDGHTQMRADAAVALAELNQAYVAEFGSDMCLSSGYRTLAQQYAIKAEKGALAATPGKSNHGWGLAVDFCSRETSGARWAWLNANGPAYGFDNPGWALRGGSGPYEPWHWEYLKGVLEDGYYYGP